MKGTSLRRFALLACFSFLVVTGCNDDPVDVDDNDDAEQSNADEQGNDEEGNDDEGNDEQGNDDEGNDEPGEPGEPGEPSDEDELAFLDDIHTMGMWLWDPTGLLDNAGGAQDELMEFMAAPHGHEEYAVDRLFMEARGYTYVDPNEEIRPVSWDPLTDPDLQPQMRDFLQRASDQGAAVEYLAAQGIWLAADEYAEVPKEKCEAVADFNRTTDNVDERFAGVHLDIEPFTVTSGPYADDYFENAGPGGYNVDWTERWEDIMVSCRETLDAYEADTGHKMSLSMDVARWAYHDGGMFEFANDADGPLDYVAIMNYYDNRPNQEGDPSFFHGDHDGMNMVGGVEENLEFWDQVPVMFAVETGPPEIAPEEWSFYDNGYTEMFEVFDEYFETYAGTHAMGMAVHYYHPTAYQGLEP